VAYYAVAVTGLLVVLLLEQINKNSKNQKVEDDTTSDDLSISGGIELGMYLFVGNAMQVFGLRTVPSDRAAFLLQLTTIFVPFLQAVMSGSLQRISNRVWIASFMALVGVGILSMDGSFDTITFAPNKQLHFSGGDALIIGAAVLYTFHCVRLELYAQCTSAVRLAFIKAFTELSLSAAGVAILVLASQLFQDTSNSMISAFVPAGATIQSFLYGFSDSVRSTSDNEAILAAGAATTWIGAVIVAYTICAQSYGQKYVEAATANLLYTTQPLYTSLFAWIFLGETLGSLGYVGGIILLLSVVLVTLDGNKRDKDVS
jgi:drug/metabolite transporter (DMT)-like permease